MYGLHTGKITLWILYTGDIEGHSTCGLGKFKRTAQGNTGNLENCKKVSTHAQKATRNGNMGKENEEEFEYDTCSIDISQAILKSNIYSYTIIKN